MNKRPSIKVLPLLFYKYRKGDGFFAKQMNEKYDYELRHYYTPFNPVFNRDGIYYNRRANVCWFETNGKAYLWNKEDFLYALASYEACEKDIKLFRQFKFIYDYDKSALSKEQMQFLSLYSNNLEVREQKRKCLKRKRMFKKRLGYWSGK